MVRALYTLHSHPGRTVASLLCSSARARSRFAASRSSSTAFRRSWTSCQRLPGPARELGMETVRDVNLSKTNADARHIPDTSYTNSSFYETQSSISTSNTVSSPFPSAGAPPGAPAEALPWPALGARSCGEPSKGLDGICGQ